MAIRDLSPFENEHWVYKMGVYLWYGAYGESEQNKIMNEILTGGIKRGPDFSI